MNLKNYQEWESRVPQEIKQDSLWQLRIYRKALFFADLVWFDSEILLADQRSKGIAWQLIDSAGSISANIEEGYGRGFGKDYARFLRISLGSARESRGWYYRGRHVFTPELLHQRMMLANEIVASLVILADQQRRK